MNAFTLPTKQAKQIHYNKRKKGSRKRLTKTRQHEVGGILVWTSIPTKNNYALNAA